MVDKGIMGIMRTGALGFFLKTLVRLGLSLLSLLMVSASFAFSQTEQKETDRIAKEAPHVYLESERFGLNFTKEKIPFVKYVSKRSEAQVYVLITSRKTADGEDFELSFSGQKDYQGIHHLLKYTSRTADSEEDIRNGVVTMLKMGFMRYVAKTSVASRIRIGLLDKVKPTDVVDKWNFWVFSVNADIFSQGEQSYSNTWIYGSLSANRVTPGWKIRTSLSTSYNRSAFIYEGSEIISTANSQSFQGLVVKSINDHWSVGAFLNSYSSTYDNVRFGFNPAPAIEYDFFPYSRSTRRQLRLLYRIGFNLVRYREETIFDKVQENLWKEGLDVTLELKENWGTISTSLGGSHYFRDFSKNRLQISTEISIRIFTGLSFNISGSASKIHDQLSLPKGGASLDEVLLRRKELATTFSYSLSIGFSYTFGSIFSNIVNPRFGSGETSVSIKMEM
jgi:hypothetical protein